VVAFWEWSRRELGMVKFGFVDHYYSMPSGGTTRNLTFSTISCARDEISLPMAVCVEAVCGGTLMLWSCMCLCVRAHAHVQLSAFFIRYFSYRSCCICACMHLYIIISVFCLTCLSVDAIVSSLFVPLVVVSSELLHVLVRCPTEL
jgi:hypothetical protein